MTRTSGNPNSISLVLYALNAILLEVRLGIIFSFSHEGAINIELFLLWGKNKTKQKKHLNQNKQTNNKKILSSGLVLLAQAAAVKPHPPFFVIQMLSSVLADSWLTEMTGSLQSESSEFPLFLISFSYRKEPFPLLCFYWEKDCFFTLFYVYGTL